MLWADIYQRHFQHYFAKPFDIQIFHDPHGASLKLATYDGALSGYRVYASMGLADRIAADAEDEGEGDAFGEAILFSDVPDKEPPRLFVNALFFILHQKIPLDARFAVGFTDLQCEFAWRYRKTAFYFTRGKGPDERFDKVRRGERFGRVFQAYFITPEEDRFLEAYGADAFEEEFAKQDGDKLSVRRQSCV